MRVALVSPYAWSAPGGVNRHVEALGRELRAAGHEACVLAPGDPRLEGPSWLVPLGGTVGVPMNGSVSHLAFGPGAVARLRTELVRGRYDVVHVHEPVAPLVASHAARWARAARVGTFHTYGTNAVTHGVAALAGSTWRVANRLHARIAVSEAAAWTGRRFYGGAAWRIVPNGVALDPAAGRPPPRAGAPLRVLFLGRAVERKGLAVLLRGFEALRDAGVPARLTIAGATAEEVAPLLLDGRGVEIAGRVGEEAKRALLRSADVLCAPSLGGESFGMVLTEAFAAGTPVVASDLPGYAEVVRDGEDGVLVPRGDPAALAAALRDLASDPGRRACLAAGATRSAGRYAWPRVAARVLEVYEDALEAAAREGAMTWLGLRPADGTAFTRPRRIAPLEPPPARPHADLARRACVAVLGGAVVVAAALGLQRVGMEAIGASLLASSPPWVLAALAVMCMSMVLRAGAWLAILRAALPDARVRTADALQGTCIGVLMSATLPARLGEPSRAIVVARRLGRPRDRLPAVLGTIVSQSLLNLVALALLGAVVLSTADVLRPDPSLMAVGAAPVAAVAAVLAAPALVRGRPALVRLRAGLAVFRAPRRGAAAAALQLAAWALQWASCWLLLVALGLGGQTGPAAAAAVLFAVNVTAVLPATPSNLGVFQAACVAVLVPHGVAPHDALAYGVVLQAVEFATAAVMGAPALVKEGLSWREVRLRALHATPVELPPRERGRDARAGA